MEQLPHFLLIPYSEQGHFNPMLSLASQLAALGCKVTFVKAERQATTSLHADTDTCKASEVPNSQAGASSVSKDCQAADAKLRAKALQEDDTMGSAPRQTNNETALLANIRFVTLPARKNTELGSGDPSTISRHEIFKKTLAGLEERQDLVAKIVEDSKAFPHPISCVICDLILWRWVRHVANHYGLRSAILSIFSGFTLYTLYLRFVIDKEIGIEDLLVSGFGMPSEKDVVAYYALTTMRDTPELKLKKHKFYKSIFECIKDVGTILVNSFKDLEAPLLPSLETLGLDVRFIGPCLPAWNENDIGLGSKLAQQAGSIFIEEEACIPWLDLQEKGSVLFVSFGSEGTLEAKQVEEIAMGIKKSGYKFLWVFRSDAPSNSGPTQIFHDNSSKHEKGMFVSWAPQRKVLQHPSIGGFLTHSGWNSTLESVTFGVPMLCLPLLGDQPVNANFVEAHLKVGIRITISHDGMVNREEVANGVKAIMKGQFTDHVSKFHQASQLALQDAHHTLVSFVQAMTHT